MTHPATPAPVRPRRAVLAAAVVVAIVAVVCLLATALTGSGTTCVLLPRYLEAQIRAVSSPTFDHHDPLYVCDGT